ncbi:hypothetical protein DM02DRAFT_148985 [Periconia macrospinosa]|uniref:Uncharacterized protein n=1 Tax=Periconia macrospinosa TaxID=97972 RepID=A0A2V1DBM1_9PLEO|nr:hypothetical protein DM02DRAFT_148985 [Periconia macrospinosa]
MRFTISTSLAIFMATMATAAAIPTPRSEGTLKVRADSGIVAHTYNGKLVVSGGTATVNFDSLSEKEKEEVLAACPAFVGGVDGEMDTACF